ncbi:hydrolase, hydrolyzing O-glycosyl compounds [Olea europaea subsp. europaea]|uniref:Hydrolase, hydrolyzing O-glycosyl compounds n=1 Tax=Olea europaea subsp. europaea TaxID=158383 RepID=A0A8S0TXH1_OLEEU|nr:hydrolase, hydrolyzing O-glycosyl compounds [Olea europaea subsp. europaea]
MAQPLSTDSRWVVNESNQRVKLACVNWVSHLDVVVAEGLSKQPVDVISKGILDMGFNCVRLTWPLFLFTNDTLASITVRQSFKNLGLVESIAGLQSNNPSIVNLSLINAYQAVVASLANNGVMIILDNHISKPGWCCSNFDGNGFFGDRYFNPDIWVKGLTKVATMFKGTKNVVAMSLRNELRGQKQNVGDWYSHSPASNIRYRAWLCLKAKKKLLWSFSEQYDSGPGYNEIHPHKVIFHPKTGLCIKRKSIYEHLVLGPCSEAEAWTYTPQKTLTIMGTYFCLQADGLALPAKLGVICSYASSKWETISDSKMHLSSKLADGSGVCLDIDSNNVVVTNACKCLNRNSTCDPGSQWFKIIDSTRCISSTKSFLGINSIFSFGAKNLLASFSW